MWTVLAKVRKSQIEKAKSRDAKEPYVAPQTKRAVNRDVEQYLIRGGKGLCKWK